MFKRGTRSCSCVGLVGFGRYTSTYKRTTDLAASTASLSIIVVCSNVMHSSGHSRYVKDSPLPALVHLIPSDGYT
eukprot:scaffold1045_cov186-Alexandrium_tamarense.AAC.3